MNKYAIPELDIEAAAKAIEADFGEALPDIRQALAEAKAGIVGRTHTPEQIMARRGRPVGSSKQPVTLRVDSSALTLLRSTGKGWQTRASEALSQYAMQYDVRGAVAA